MQASASAMPKVTAVTTVNVSSHGVIKDLLLQPGTDSSIVMIQEHHADDTRLADVQHYAAQAGFTGLWAAAPSTGRGGTFGGLAVIAP